jgi:hypothetical protein
VPNDSLRPAESLTHFSNARQRDLNSTRGLRVEPFPTVSTDNHSRLPLKSGARRSVSSVHGAFHMWSDCHLGAFSAMPLAACAPHRRSGIGSSATLRRMTRDSSSPAVSRNDKASIVLASERLQLEDDHSRQARRQSIFARPARTEGRYASILQALLDHSSDDSPLIRPSPVRASELEAH